MSKIKVTQIQPLSGTILYLTGTLSASSGVNFPNETISGSTAILTTLTASKAYIDVLDVSQINSTTTTETSLEVVDKLIIAASGSTGSTANDAGYQIGAYSSTTYPPASMIFSGSALKLSVTGSTIPVMFLSGSGKVGIGVTDPDAQLEVFDTATQLKLSYDSTNYATLAVASDGQLDITTVDASAAAGHICLVPDGNVGIGTTSPAALTHLYKAALSQIALPLEMLRLEVVDEGVDMAAGHGPGIDFYVGETGGSDHGGTLAVVREIEGDADSAAAMVFHTAADDTTPAERMRITSVGRVGVGTTSPDTLLHVSGTSKFNGAMELASTFTVAGVSTFSTGVTGSSGLCITGSAKFNDEIEVAGAAEFDGNVTLGNAATDVTTVTGQFTGSNGAYITGSVLVSGSVTLGQNAEDIIIITGQLTASNGIEVDSISLSNDLTASGIELNERITVNGTSSFDGPVVINESGNAVDFRVESDTETHMLFVDASHDRVGIGTSSPWTALDVDGHVSLSTQSDPGTQSGKISLYAKSISGVAELVVQDDAGNRTTISQLNHQTLLEDNNAEAYKFQEGTTHYMVFSTENGEEKITSSKNFIFSGSISGSAGMEMTGSAKFSSGNDGAGTIVVRSGNASQYSKISMGTNANKVTIGVPGGSGTFFSDTAAGDLVLRVDDNNGKIHIGAGTSGGAGLIITEHGGSDPRIGIGTASPNAALDVAGHVFPHSDDTYDLGSSSYRWRNIYTGDLHLKNDRGDWTILEEEDFLCVVNNKTGKKYEMMLKPIDED